MNPLTEFEKRFEIKSATIISDVPHEPRTIIWLFGLYCSTFATLAIYSSPWWHYLTITAIYLIACQDVRKYYRKRPRNRPD